MKKIVIGIAAVALLASLGFNVKLNNDLQYSKTLNETIQSELIDCGKIREDLKDDITGLENDIREADLRVSLAEEKLQGVMDELSDTNKLIQSIDDLLEGNGVTIVKIEELISENNKLQRQIAKLTTEVEEYKALSLSDPVDDSIEEPIIEEAEVIVNVPTDQWSDSVKKVIDLINNRIGELQAASDTLPTLSLERIMINQEIEVLDGAISELEAIKSSIDNF